LDVVFYVPAGSSLYLFSDGVFEVLTAERQWHLTDFVPYLLQPATDGTNECRRLHQAVKAICRSDSLEDDFSLLVVTFP
jgi:serine phosphatase RsbU (regulator of sigma subunit)